MIISQSNRFPTTTVVVTKTSACQHAKIPQNTYLKTARASPTLAVYKVLLAPAAVPCGIESSVISLPFLLKLVPDPDLDSLEEDRKLLSFSLCTPSPNRRFVSSSSISSVVVGSLVVDGVTIGELAVSAEMGLPEESSKRRKQVTAVQPE